MRALAIAAVLVLAVAAGGLVFVSCGRVDVAATSPHWTLTEWILETAMESAVARSAQGIEPPHSLEDEALLREGAAAYDEMCASCHGAPGVERGVLAEGLNPAPPALADTAGEWSPAELYWITKHGIRMTGMPAFGPTHTDEQLWQVVALVARLPRLSAAEYRALVGAKTDAAPAPAHVHGPDERRGHSHSHR